MVTYNCKYCNYTTTRRCDYTKHNNTRKHKYNTTSKQALIKHKSSSKEALLSTLMNTPNTIICEYCNSIFKSNRCLHNHQLKSCIKIPNDIKNKLILKHNSNPKTKEDNKLELIPVTNNITNNINNTNNTNNSNNTNCNNDNSINDNSITDNSITNNIQNVVNINLDNVNQDNICIKDGKKYLKILPVTKEDTSHFTHEDKIDIFKSCSNLYNRYQKKLYDNPSNLNITIVDKKKDLFTYVEPISNDTEDDVADYIMTNLVKSNMCNIEEMYEDVQGDLTYSTNRTIKRELQKYNEDNIKTLRRLKHITYIKQLRNKEDREEILNNLVNLEPSKNTKYVLIGYEDDVETED